MSIQTINVGGYANDGTGDDLRTAFEKVNANFALLGATAGAQNGANLGAGVGIFSQRNNSTTNLEFKTLTSTDSSVEITATTTTVNLKNKSKLINDDNPQLGENLDLNGRNIIDVAGGGSVNTSVFGLDVRLINGLVELMIASNSVNIDFGTILSPTGFTGVAGNDGFDVDMNGLLLNGFVGTPNVSNLDFGQIAQI